MKISETSPILYGLHSFRYTVGTRQYGRLSEPKSQYVYRLIYLWEGALDLELNGRLTHCRASDAVYLTPSDRYRLLPSGSDFSLYNLFFDFLPDRLTQSQRRDCVFLSDYRAELCPPRLLLSDAHMLNSGCVLHGVGIQPILESLLSTDVADPLYPFHAHAAITSILSQLLRADAGRWGGCSRVGEILAYLRLNPDGDLSADALSRRFSYHKNYINQLIRGATGKTLSAYVRGVKIGAACARLSEGDASLSELALSLGYYDYSHFYRAFVAETGISPAAYLRGARQTDANST